MRWYLFAKQQSHSMKLPPSLDAFRQKVLRSHYTILQWKSSNVSAHIRFCLDTWWGKFIVSGSNNSSTSPRIHYPLISLQVQNWMLNQRCKCRKSNLKSSDMCQCQGCENNDQNDDLNDIVTGSDIKSKESCDEN